MKRVNILSKLEKAKIVAVIRNESETKAQEVSEKLIDNGINGIEVTLTTPNALSIILHLKEKYKNLEEVVIGAGTVIDTENTILAINAGAEFIVSPIFDSKIAELCNLNQIPYIPGCMTVNEMKEALIAGSDVIKLFPSHVYDKKIISSIKAPLPQINLMPSGGVTLDNLSEWFEVGATMVSAGGRLTNPDEDTAKIAKEFLEKVNNSFKS